MIKIQNSGYSKYGVISAPAPTGGNDTAVLQAKIDEASAAGTGLSTGQYVELEFQSGTYYIDGLEWKSNVFYNFGAAIFKKYRERADVPAGYGQLLAGSMIRTVDTLTNGSYYGKYYNIKTSGGTFDTNGFICPANIFRFENVTDAVLELPTVRHSKPNYATGTFTSTLSSGATSATLAAPWTGTTGTYDVLFSNDDTRKVSLISGATTATWTSALSSAAIATFEFIVPSGWAFQIGGRNIRVISPTVLNLSLIHI